MKNLEIVKEIGSLVVNVGVINIVSGIVRTNVPLAGAGIITKICTASGSTMLGSLVAKKVEEHYYEEFDKITNLFKRSVNKEREEEK